MSAPQRSPKLRLRRELRDHGQKGMTWLSGRHTPTRPGSSMRQEQPKANRQ